MLGIAVPMIIKVKAEGASLAFTVGFPFYHIENHRWLLLPLEDIE